MFVILSILVCAALSFLRSFIAQPYLERLGRRWILKDQSLTRWVTCAFKTFYFSLAAPLEYTALRYTKFFPPILGGTGATRFLWEFGTKSSYEDTIVNVIYGVSFGYHLHSTIYHIWIIERRKDYYQMIFHHLLTLGLIILSYNDGFTRIGLLVIFMNDVCDITVYLTKMLGDTVFVSTSFVSYFLMTLSYTYFRILVFPVSMLYSILFEAPNDAQKKTMYTSMLLSLYFLQLYWFCLIIKIGKNLLNSGLRKDLVDQ